MKVFGYTDSKVLEPIELTTAEVVANEIDPWRLDLFDPNPVVFRRPGKPDLNFRRLRDIAFAFKLDLGRGVIGVHDCQVASCVSGTTQDNETGIALTASEPVDFCEHLRRYLGLLGVKFQVQAKLVCAPQSADALKVQGTQVVCTKDSEGLNQFPMTFVGEMFQELSVPIRLPNQINWVFTALAAFSPTVINNAIWQVLSAKKVTSVQVLVEGQQHDAVCSTLKAIGIHPKYRKMIGQIGFNHDGCAYEVLMTDDGQTASEHFRRQDKHWCSVHSLRACGVDRVVGTRIAWHDLSLGSTWPVCGAGIKFVLDGRKDESLTFIKIEEAGFPIRAPMGLKHDNACYTSLARKHPELSTRELFELVRRSPNW